MSDSRYQPLPGFRDLAPQEHALRAYLFGAWREVAHRYGFVEWEAPMVEPTDLYLKKSGGELPTQLFRFKDQGERDVSLRPELTASLGRIVSTRHLDYNKPLKWYEIGPCFRYEKPQKGRQREFVQFNVDILGEQGTGADAELLALAIDSMRVLGFKSTDFVVRVSDREVWLHYAQEHGIAEERTQDFLSVIDKLERDRPEVSAEKLAAFGLTREQITDFIANPPPGVSLRYDEVLEDLQARGLNEYVQLDLGVVRGLAYYTGLVFEIFDKGHSLRAVAGGGRYDKLISTLTDGAVDMPATGFAMGDAVIAHLIEACPEARALRDAALAPHTCDVCLILAAPEMRQSMLLLASTLRDAGVSVDVPLAWSKMTKQLRHAERCGATYAAIIGTEFPDIELKHMATRESRHVKLEELVCGLIPH